MSKVLTIQRSKWRRGQDGTDTHLSNDKGMCCLGFDAVACGLPTQTIELVGDPEELAHHLSDAEIEARRDYFSGRGKLCGYSFEQSEAIEAAIAINDRSDIADAEREAKLIPILKQLGWDDVVFVD